MFLPNGLCYIYRGQWSIESEVEFLQISCLTIIESGKQLGIPEAKTQSGIVYGSIRWCLLPTCQGRWRNRFYVLLIWNNEPRFWCCVSSLLFQICFVRFLFRTQHHTVQPVNVYNAYTENFQSPFHRGSTSRLELADIRSLLPRLWNVAASMAMAFLTLSSNRCRIRKRLNCIQSNLRSNNCRKRCFEQSE